MPALAGSPALTEPRRRRLSVQNCMFPRRNQQAPQLQTQGYASRGSVGLYRIARF